VASPRTLEVHLLGGFRVSVGGQPVPATAWRRKRAAAVVKLLALEPTHRLHREQITDALWPELDPDDAANNLRVALHHARQRLHAHDSGADADALLDREGDVISLGPPERVRVDVDDFESAVRRAWQSPDPAASETALAMYGGDLLPEDLYEDRAAGRRTTLRASYLTLLRRLAQLYEQRVELGQAIAVWHRLLAAEPLDEDGHAALIRLLAQVGQPHQASAQYDALVALLARDLGAEPQPATRELIAAIRDGRFPQTAQPLAPATTVAKPVPAERPHGLPAPVDELIGREREVAELRHLLATARLVTLTGPGGVGKTRLALAAAHAAAEIFPDGACFADLAPLEDPALVLPTIARSLGVREEPGVSLLDTVTDHLGSRALLLLIDNMEHVLVAAPVVPDLLATCAGLKVLVTSRGRLKLHGEHEYLVQPLALPDPADLDDARNARALPSAPLTSVPAVALFVRRASEAQTGFALTGFNAPTIAAICHRLDGLPLAIELAAARVRVLPPADLLEKLAQPLSILTDGPRDVPDRQRTLRATIAWSYDLLTEPEQDLFARLAVFAGGFTLEAAERVGGRRSEGGGALVDQSSDLRPPSSDSVLDLAASLIDQSLVRQTAQPDGTSRLRMLETIRAYARERLEFSGEAEAMRELHARYFLALAQFAAPELTGPEQGAWLDRLETEHDNLRQALTTFRELEASEVELRLAAALWRFWWQRGYLSEGRDWLEQALADAGDADPALLADAHDGAGALAEAQADLAAAALHHEAALKLRRAIGDRSGEIRSLTDFGIVADKLGDSERAVRLFEEGIALARDEDDRPRLAACLANLGFVCLDRGDSQRAATAFRESLELFRDLEDQQNLSYVLGGLGNLVFLEGDYAGAAALQEESLRVLRELGDRQGVADATADLGHAVQRQGDLDRAEELYVEAWRRYQELGDRGGIAFALLHLGRLAHLRGDIGRAEALLGESYHIAGQIGDKQFLTEAIESLAGVTCDRGDVALCARLLGVAEVLRETSGIALPAVLQPELDRCVATARAALGDAGFAAARGEGRALTPEQVMPALAATGSS
jgi:predicted ATPase/DNA-binding SARP family transcriptional activator/Flp pilus assembly protein TadD